MEDNIIEDIVQDTEDFEEYFNPDVLDAHSCSANSCGGVCEICGAITDYELYGG